MGNMDNAIHIPSRQKPAIGSNERPVVRVSAEAYNTLVEIYNESTLSMAQVASLLITEGKKFVVYDKD